MSEGKQENPLVRFLAVPFIIVWGLVFTVSAFWVSLRQTIDEWVGDVNFLYLGVGFLFFYTAVLVAEKNVMRSKFLNLLKEIQGFLIGKRYHQKIEAIQILINAVNKGNEKAANLTGLINVILLLCVVLDLLHGVIIILAFLESLFELIDPLAETSCKLRNL